MLQSLFSEIFKEDIGGRYPRAAPVVTTERKDICFRPFSTQQRPNVFLSDAWRALATYHGRVFTTL